MIGLELPEDFSDKQPLGFVYRITDKETGKFYIGQKKMQKNVTRPPLKGKVRKRHLIKESDWKKYTSSSNDLNKDISEHGLDRFTFEILEFCYDKWSLTYWELWWQLHDNVMFRYDSYNGIINIRLSKFKSIIEKYASDPRIFGNGRSLK